MELKPCPFCGGEAIAFYKKESAANYGNEYHGVTCMSCAAAIYGFPLKEQALERWNRRIYDE